MSATPLLPTGRFDLILADPPWQFRDKANAGARGAAHKYPCMDWREIARLPVSGICAENCMLAMWWVDTMAEEAIAVATMWGFERIKMTGFTWAKVGVTGLPAVGMGHWTRGNAENCLFGFRGRPKRVDAGVSQLIIAPAGRHSQKPAEARTRLERLLGDCSRIELFAREGVQGWAAWGLEVNEESSP